jgi:stringent starvation protein B
MTSAITPPDAQGGSTRPYLIRALHDWCTDNGFTPYLAVFVEPGVQVPMEYVKNNEIVLNVGFEATSGLKLGNDFIEFKARFGGVAREIMVPVDHVVAIYARENGQGMAFPMPSGAGDQAGAAAGTAEEAAPSPLKPARGLRLASTEAPAAGNSEAPSSQSEAPDDDPPPSSTPPRPALKRVK